MASLLVEYAKLISNYHLESVNNNNVYVYHVLYLAEANGTHLLIRSQVIGISVSVLILIILIGKGIMAILYSVMIVLSHTVVVILSSIVVVTVV